MSTPDRPFTINDLRVALANLMIKERLPGDTPVVLSSDPEGNHFAPMEGWTDALYANGETYSLPDTEESKEERKLGHFPPTNARKVVCLYPLDVHPGLDPFAGPDKN
ncbi:hypothetical protein ABT093_19755 [Kitasatospora sp. NPDC002551]|uniref:hypothetical protein n=1 Tax=Kitasatospora sp. NPDC002551 TaxID=3154539 RepID=UPI00332CCD96